MRRRKHKAKNLRRHQKPRGLAHRLDRIAKECAVLLKEPYRSIDHGEMLYDEKGLPK